MCKFSGYAPFFRPWKRGCLSMCQWKLTTSQYGRFCCTACQSKSYRPLWRLSLTVCCNSLPMHHTASLSKSYRPLWRLLLTVCCNRLPMHHWQLPTSWCGSFNPLHQCFQGVVAELPNDAPLLHDVVVASHAHTCQQHHKYRRMDPFVVPGHKLQQLKPQTTATKIPFTSRNKQD